MAYTSADLDKIDRAIAGGVLEWQHGQRRIRYQSMDDMLKARAHVAASIAAASASSSQGATRRYAFKTARGD